MVRRSSVIWIWVVAAALTMTVGGLLLPERYEKSRRLLLSRTPEAVWFALTDSTAIRRWREDLIELERLPDRNGRPAWREIMDDGTGVVVESADWDAPVHLRLIRTPEAQREPSPTEWEYVVERAPEGVALTVTERGRITNPVRRFVVQFLAGARGALDRQLAGLAGYFEEPARID
jgi:uncharacterized protein YndB with AHSA1/START domain